MERKITDKMIIETKNLIMSEYIKYFKCDVEENLFDVNIGFNAYDVLFVTLKIVLKFNIKYFDLNKLLDIKMTIKDLSNFLFEYV